MIGLFEYLDRKFGPKCVVCNKPWLDRWYYTTKCTTCMYKLIAKNLKGKEGK